MTTRGRPGLLVERNGLGSSFRHPDPAVRAFQAIAEPG